MTCVVGIETPTGVVLGADSASVGSGITRSATPKAFVVHGIGYAVSGSWRLINIMRHNFEPPLHPDGLDDEGYLVSHWTEALRSKLGETGARRKSDEVEGTDDGSGLIAYRGRLYTFDQDFQIQRHAEGYYASGSGIAQAFGSLHTTAALGLGAVRRVELALAAAAEHNWGVRAPFLVIEVQA